MIDKDHSDTKHKTRSGVTRKMAHEDASSRYFEIVIEPQATYHKSVNVLDTCLYVVEGSGTLVIGDDTYPLRPSSFNSSPARFPQVISNTGSEPLRILEIQPSQGGANYFYPVPR